MRDIGIGAAQYYIGLHKEAFETSYFSECYTTAYIKNYDLDTYFYFSDEYKEQEAVFKEQVESLGKERASLRLEEVRNKAEEEIREAENLLKDYDSIMESSGELVEELIGVEAAGFDWDAAREQLKDSGRFENHR